MMQLIGVERTTAVITVHFTWLLSHEDQYLWLPSKTLKKPQVVTDGLKT